MSGFPPRNGDESSMSFERRVVRPQTMVFGSSDLRRRCRCRHSSGQRRRSVRAGRGSCGGSGLRGRLGDVHVGPFGATPEGPSSCRWRGVPGFSLRPPGRRGPGQVGAAAAVIPSPPRSEALDHTSAVPGTGADRDHGHDGGRHDRAPVGDAVVVLQHRQATGGSPGGIPPSEGQRYWFLVDDGDHRERHQRRQRNGQQHLEQQAERRRRPCGQPR